MKTTSRIKITMKTFTFTSPAIENCVWSIIILMLFCSLLFFFLLSTDMKMKLKAQARRETEKLVN